MSSIEKQKRIEDIMRELGSAIDSVLKDFWDNMGFVLIVFEFFKPGISNYISNGQRSDIIKALRETADRLEAKEDIPPAHKTMQ